MCSGALLDREFRPCAPCFPRVFRPWAPPVGPARGPRPWAPPTGPARGPRPRPTTSSRTPSRSTRRTRARHRHGPSQQRSRTLRFYYLIPKSRAAPPKSSRIHPGRAGLVLIPWTARHSNDVSPLGTVNGETESSGNIC